jgi:hypothetical protein
MSQSSAYGRGPEPAELALDGFKRELLNFRELGAKLLHAADDLLAAEDALYKVAGVVARPQFERELGAVLAMRRGEPFWERTPAEPPKRKRIPVVEART